MLPFEDIPDDTVPVTAYLKELLKLATEDRPLLIFLDSVDELTGSQDANKMSWLPLKIPPHCKIVVSCTYEEGNPQLMQDLNFLRQMIVDDSQVRSSPLNFAFLSCVAVSGGDCAGHRVGLENHEALDEERRPHPQQLPVARGGERHGQLHPPHLHQACLPGGDPGSVVFSLIILAAGLSVEELHGAREDGVDDQRAGLRIPGTSV